MSNPIVEASNPVVDALDLAERRADRLIARAVRIFHSELEAVRKATRELPPPARQWIEDGLPLDEMARRYVLETLSRHDWVQSDAAEILGISRYRLCRMLQRWGLSDEVALRRRAIESPQSD